MSAENDTRARRAQLAYATRDLEQIPVRRGDVREQVIMDFLLERRGLRLDQIGSVFKVPRLASQIAKHEGDHDVLVDELLSEGWRVNPLVEERRIFEEAIHERKRSESLRQMATNDGQPSALSQVVEYWGIGPVTPEDKQNFNAASGSGFWGLDGLRAVLVGRGIDPNVPFAGVQP